MNVSLSQERLNLPKEVEEYEVDDCVDHTNHHVEHADDKEVLIDWLGFHGQIWTLRVGMVVDG